MFTCCKLSIAGMKKSHCSAVAVAAAVAIAVKSGQISVTMFLTDAETIFAGALLLF